MKSKLIHEDRQKTYALIFDQGDEAIAELKAFAAEHRLDAAQFTGIGAFSAVTLGYFDWVRKDYEEILLNEQVEVVTLAGDVAAKDGKPEVHAHVTVGRRNGSAYGGHLLEGHVRPTLEIILVESPEHLRKRVDETTGLALIDLDI